MRLVRPALVLLVLAVSPAAGSDAPLIIDLGRFSAERPADAPPAGWEPLVFPKIARHTRYTLTSYDGAAVVRAEADASASGLIRAVEVDASRFPVLEWRWKIAEAVAGSDPARKEGDDYAARIYVAFKYDPARVPVLDKVKYELAKLFYGEYPPHAGLNYIWATATPVGTVVPNAYTDRVRMIVVRNGATDAGRWVSESRNVLEDYRRAFGEDPPPIAGVAIMTDTDNTGGKAVAWYGDIRLRGAK